MAGHLINFITIMRRENHIIVMEYKVSKLPHKTQVLIIIIKTQTKFLLIRATLLSTKTVIMKI